LVLLNHNQDKRSFSIAKKSGLPISRSQTSSIAKKSGSAELPKPDYLIMLVYASIRPTDRTVAQTIN
jgi:hypothetical protein